MQADGHAVERASRAHGAFRIVHIIRIEQPDTDKALQCGVEIRHLLGHEFELIGGLVLRENQPLPVVDDAARRGQRLDAYAIALRQVGVVVITYDLQPHQTTDEQQ